MLGLAGEGKSVTVEYDSHKHCCNYCAFSILWLSF